MDYPQTILTYPQRGLISNIVDYSQSNQIPLFYQATLIL